MTEQVYRHQFRPVIEDGAVAMNDIFELGGLDRQGMKEPVHSQVDGL
jgi:hypothetical protein